MWKFNYIKLKHEQVTIKFANAFERLKRWLASAVACHLPSKHRTGSFNWGGFADDNAPLPQQTWKDITGILQKFYGGIFQDAITTHFLWKKLIPPHTPLHHSSLHHITEHMDPVTVEMGSSIWRSWLCIYCWISRRQLLGCTMYKNWKILGKTIYV